jgi:hypothetical protein
MSVHAREVRRQGKRREGEREERADPRLELAGRLGNAAVARLAAEARVARRYDKPDPAESSYNDIELKEHHVVDYKKIAKFGEDVSKVFGQEARRVAFRPLFNKWEDVTIGELLNVRQLRETALFKDERDAFASTMLAGFRERARTAPRVVTIGAGSVSNEPNLGPIDDRKYADLKKAETAYTKLTSSGQMTPDDEVDQSLVMDYWVWNHANLFVGPADRVWDPGDSFDRYAKHVMSGVRYQRLLRLNGLIDEYFDASEDVPEEGGRSDKAKVLKKIRLVIAKLGSDDNQRVEIADTFGLWEQFKGKWRPKGAPDSGLPPL